MSFLKNLSERVLVGDGATGTLLYAQGIDRCFEELNETDPEKIREVHEAYLKAGANIIQTNTYAANELKLARYDLEEKAPLLNKLGVQIAREAANKYGAYVLATIGGIRGVQKKSISLHQIVRSFEKQLAALLEGDIDGLLLETYYDFEEMKACLSIARKMTDLPIVANVSISEVGVLQGGISLKEALLTLEDLGADVVGTNCHMGPFHMLKSFEEIPLLGRAYLSAYPNASLPYYKDGRLVYQANPEYFGKSAKQFVEEGVRLIGGCCGTTPEHIRAAVTAVKNIAPIQEKHVKTVTKKEIIVMEKEKKSSPLHTIVQQEKSVIVELDPPKKLQTETFFEGAKKIAEAGADAITLADNSLATPRVCNLTLASILKREYGIRPLVHLTCRDRNLIGLQSHLMGLHTLGIDQLLAVTGDPTKVGDFPGATSVFDIASFDLIRLIKQMNQGLSFSGKDLGAKTNFSVAAAFNPNVSSIESAVKRMEKKIQCGADYFLTQPVYSIEKVREIKEATKHIEAPIYIGVMPLTSTRNAEFLHNEVPGIKLSDEARKRMAAHSGDKDASTREGIEIAKEIIDEIAKYFQGLYLITPFLRYEITVELTKYWVNKKSPIENQLTLSYLEPSKERKM